MTLSPDELVRYDRHLKLPEVGRDGQEKLKASSVLLIGAGGLGSPLALYLAAAGIGRIGIVDHDVVDVTNLQRQVLHRSADVGRRKTDSARDHLRALNPHIVIETHDVSINAGNALELVAAYDVVADGSDNFPTRYLANDACVIANKPNVHGSVFRFEGQASVFHPPAGPCYRCLFPEPPPTGSVPSCEEGGVLGVLPGIIGLVQATEVIKLALGAGEPLIGRLLLFDAMAMEFRQIRIRRNRNCAVCGDAPTIRALHEIDWSCEAPSAAREVSPDELLQRIERGDVPLLVDVREPHEWISGHLENAVHLPLGSVAARMHEIPRDRDVVVYCRSGARSGRAAEFLREQGYTRVQNLTGGIVRWLRENGRLVT